MFSNQIGSPHGRFPRRSLLSSPSILARRNGPLFSGTPPPTSNSAWQYNYSPYATPAPSTLIPSTDFSPPATFSSSTTSTIQNFSNVLRWDDDGHLHPIEFFIKKYGGSKEYPPMQWTKAAEDLRIDVTDDKPYNIFEFVACYGGTQNNPPEEWLSSATSPSDADVDATSTGFRKRKLSHTPTFLFRVAPPKLQYPTGSVDENVNARSALGFLRSSTHVRDVIDWDPHPHSLDKFPPLKKFVTAQARFPEFRVRSIKNFSHSVMGSHNLT